MQKSCDLLKSFKCPGQFHKYRMSEAKGQRSDGLIEIWSSFEARSRAMMSYTLEPYSSLSSMLYPTPLLLSCCAPALRNNNKRVTMHSEFDMQDAVDLF